MLHNPNCLLSPTKHHICECTVEPCKCAPGMCQNQHGVEVCKICGTRRTGILSYIDNTTLADRQFRNRDLEGELLELSLIK